VNHSLSHKVFSVALAFLVLFSTLSITVEKHFCGDTLIDVAVFSEAKGCGMEMKSETKNKKPCCKDVIEIIEGQDELNTVSFDHVDNDTQLAFTSFVYAYTSLFESLPKPIIPHKNYISPNLVVDIQLLDAVFLI
jgi:hypothetical protein